MGESSSRGPKASVQYVRTLAKRLDRVMMRGMETKKDLNDLFELVYSILSTMNPEIVAELPTQGKERLSSGQLKLILFNRTEEE